MGTPPPEWPSIDADESLRELGRRIRVARDNIGISQRELARRAHINTATVCGLEKGHGSSLRSLFCVLRVLGVGIGFCSAADPNRIPIVDATDASGARCAA